MRLVIPYKSEYDKEFLDWLLERVKGEIIKSINVKKLRKFDEIQETLQIFKLKPHMLKQPVDFVQTIFKGIDLLRYKHIKDAYIIYIKPNVVHSYYLATIDSLCKFVNCGRNDIRGYPIFSKTFNRVSAQISKYYKIYLRESLIV